MTPVLKILMVGDLFGKTGRELFARHIDAVREQYAIDATIVNGENSADGKGITPDIAAFFKKHNVAVVTTGNHVWDKKDIIPYMSESDFVLRPANYPDECPGSGMTFFVCKGYKVAVINVMGRLFMPVQLDCPVKKAQTLVEEAREQTPIILVDMHAETTSEKMAMGRYLDGRVAAVPGTHTHVPTADETIFPGGTAYISDVGMSGPYDSVIGMDKEIVIQKYTTGIPVRYQPAKQDARLSAVLLEVEESNGKAKSIRRIQERVS